MLVKHTSLQARGRQTRRERGVVMLVALVVLVVMTLAGIALMRSMDTTNLIAGNMAFKQAGTHSADTGVEVAIGWLELNRAGTGLDLDLPSNGYKSSIGNSPNANLAGYALGEDYWKQLTTTTLGPYKALCNLPIAGGACSGSPVANASGNKLSFVIHRLCASTGTKNGNQCSYVPGTVVSTGNNEGTEGDALTGSGSSMYYRITVRVEGPRNSVSYVQTIVNL
jgi:type IV pilus assembly protein PilX